MALVIHGSFSDPFRTKLLGKRVERHDDPEDDGEENNDGWKIAIFIIACIILFNILSR